MSIQRQINRNASPARAAGRKGTFDRKILCTIRINERTERALHATKGWRSRTRTEWLGR